MKVVPHPLKGCFKFYIYTVLLPNVTHPTEIFAPEHAARQFENQKFVLKCDESKFYCTNPFLILQIRGSGVLRFAKITD